MGDRDMINTTRPLTIFAAVMFVIGVGGIVLYINDGSGAAGLLLVMGVIAIPLSFFAGFLAFRSAKQSRR